MANESPAAPSSKAGKARYSKFTRWWLTRRLLYNSVLVGLVAWMIHNGWEVFAELGWKTLVTGVFYYFGAANIIYMLPWLVHQLILALQGGSREDSTIFSSFPSFWFAVVFVGCSAATVFLMLTNAFESFIE